MRNIIWDQAREILFGTIIRDTEVYLGPWGVLKFGFNFDYNILVKYFVVDLWIPLPKVRYRVSELVNTFLTGMK